MLDNSHNDPHMMHAQMSHEVSVHEEPYEKQLKRKQDAFLDSYAWYMREKNSIAKSVLERNVIELELVDPNFTFRIE